MLHAKMFPGLHVLNSLKNDKKFMEEFWKYYVISKHQVSSEKIILAPASTLLFTPPSHKVDEVYY